MDCIMTHSIQMWQQWHLWNNYERINAAAIRVYTEMSMVADVIDMNMKSP